MLSAPPSSDEALIVSSVSTGGASIVKITLTSEPSSSVTSAVTLIVGRVSLCQTARSSRSEGRMPRITVLP